MSESIAKSNSAENAESEIKSSPVEVPKVEVQPDTGVVKTKTKTKNPKETRRKNDKSGRIFLFEVILDNLQLSYCTEFMNRCYKGPNCVSFKYFNQKSLTICQNNPVMQECYEKKTGTSALFTMTMEEMEVARQEFIVTIEAFRSTPDENIPLGTGTLTLTNLMKCICALYDANEFRKAVEKEEMKLKPPCMPKQVKEVFSETLHQYVVLTSPPESTCNEAATLSVYVRLTCFGQIMQTNCEIKYENRNDDDFPKYVNCPGGCKPRCC